MGIARYLAPSFLSALAVWGAAPALANCSHYVSYLETPDGQCIDLTSLTGGVPPSSGQPAAIPTVPTGLVAQIPIIGRDGGIPIVLVRLTGTQGTQEFPMLFDTGATGTQITTAMAQAIGLDIEGIVAVTVADGRQVQYPAGYLQTVELGGLTQQEVPAWVGGGVPLLGQNVYGQYRILIDTDRIELYR